MAEANECKVYVGNLPFSTGFEELKTLFSACGEVTEATVIANKFTGRSKGFGFVTFKEEASAKKAIAEMNGKDVEGRQIKVTPAKPMEERKEESPSRRGKSEEKAEEKKE
jgi:heterogeneous nuclear ribonucleoprotein G